MRIISSLHDHFRDAGGTTSLVSGAFNPIHLGHIGLIHRAAELDRDHLLVFPNDLDPRKLYEPMSDRIEWVRLAIEECAPDLVDRVTIVDDPSIAQSLSAFHDLLGRNRERVTRVVGSDKPIAGVSLEGAIETVVIDRTDAASRDIRKCIRQGKTEDLPIPRAVLEDIIARGKYQNRDFVPRRIPSDIPDVYLDAAVSQVIQAQKDTSAKYRVRVLDRATAAKMIRSGDVFYIVDDCGVLANFYFQDLGEFEGKRVVKCGGLTVCMSDLEFAKSNVIQIVRHILSIIDQFYSDAIIVARSHDRILRHAGDSFQGKRSIAEFAEDFPGIFALYASGKNPDDYRPDDPLGIIIRFPKD